MYFLLREVKPRVERSVNLGDASPQRGTALPTPRPFTIGPPLTTDGPKDYLFPGGCEGNGGRPEACEIQNQRKRRQTLKLRKRFPPLLGSARRPEERNKLKHPGAFSGFKTSI